MPIIAFLLVVFVDGEPYRPQDNIFFYDELVCTRYKIIFHILLNIWRPRNSDFRFKHVKKFVNIFGRPLHN